jgi:hypothetical protein
MIGEGRRHGNDFRESLGGLRVVPKHPGVYRRENFVFHLPHLFPTRRNKNVS